MTFTVNSITRCSGAQSHIHVNLTVNGVNRTKTLTVDEIALEKDDWEEAIVNRIRSAFKENSVGNVNQRLQAIAGQTFKV